jgi:hypothetical protein
MERIFNRMGLTDSHQSIFITLQSGGNMKKAGFLSLAVVLLMSSVFLSAGVRTAAAGMPTIMEFNTMAALPRPYTGSANPIRGISGGGLPWVISSANGELKANGKLEVKVTGLVIDPNDPAAIAAGRAGINPSPTFIAIVSCLSKDANGAATTVNVQTNAFPATSTGNSKIEDTVSLPQPCIAPIVFVASPGGTWFAATGN